MTHPAVTKVCETARERLLSQLVYDLSNIGPIYVGHDRPYQERNDGVRVETDRLKIKVGDLVIGRCGAIGTALAVPGSDGNDGWSIRVLGTEKIQNWSNESFRAVKGLNPRCYLEGDEYAILRLIQRCDCGSTRENGLRETRVTYDRLDGDDVIITVRVYLDSAKWDMRVPTYREYLKPGGKEALYELLDTAIAAQKDTPGHPFYEYEQAKLAAAAKYYAESAVQPQTTEPQPL